MGKRLDAWLGKHQWIGLVIALAIVVGVWWAAGGAA